MIILPISYFILQDLPNECLFISNHIPD